MKKLFLSIIMTIALLILVGCESPFSEVEDKIDAIQNAIDIAEQVDNLDSTISTIIADGKAINDLGSADLATINGALTEINNLLDNGSTAEILTSYAESQGLSLTTEITTDVKAYTDQFDTNGLTAEEAEIVNLVNSILSKL